MAKSSSGSNARISGIICIVVCLLFVAVAVFMFHENATFDGKYEKITAKITDIDTYRRKGKTRHRAYVSYEYEGEQYNHVSIGSYSSSTGLGKYIDVYIDPNDPDETKSKPSGVIVFVMLLSGGFIGFWGVRLLSNSGSKGSIDLRMKGQLVYANVTYCSPTGITLNRQDTYQIKAEYIDGNGKTRFVKTELLDFDPTSYVFENNGQIKVYIDPKKPSKYYIDTNEINLICQQKNAYSSQAGFNPNIYN